MKLTRGQENCPYCHPKADNYAEPIVGDLDDIGAGLILGDDGWYFGSWDYDVIKTTNSPVIACPICRRDLGSGTA